MKGFNHGKPISEETRKKMSEAAKRTLNGYKKGHKKVFFAHSEETKKRLSEYAKSIGRKPSGMLGYKFSDESRQKMRDSALANPSRYWLGKDRSAIFTPEYRRKMSVASKKVVAEGRHNFYIDGRTPENQKVRRSLEIKLWREAVFARDDFTCQACRKRGGRLHAHHIKPFARHPELRTVVKNGQTLCVPCHKKTDTYGRFRKVIPTK